MNTFDVECIKCGKLIRLIRPKNPPALNDNYWKCSECIYRYRQNNPINYDKLIRDLDKLDKEKDDRTSI